MKVKMSTIKPEHIPTLVAIIEQMHDQLAIVLETAGTRGVYNSNLVEIKEHAKLRLAEVGIELEQE